MIKWKSDDETYLYPIFNLILIKDFNRRSLMPIQFNSDFKN